MTKPFTTMLSHTSLLLMKRGGGKSPGRPRTGCSWLNLLGEKKNASGVELPSRTYCSARNRRVVAAIGSHERGWERASVDGQCEDMAREKRRTSSSCACPFPCLSLPDFGAFEHDFCSNTPNTPQTNGQQCFGDFPCGWALSFLSFLVILATLFYAPCSDLRPPPTQDRVLTMTFSSATQYSTHIHTTTAQLLAAAPQSS